MKTTNAKSIAFQTPVVPGTDNGMAKTQRKMGSQRKQKLHVHHAEEANLETESKEPEQEEHEIEYMPPRPLDLPDYPDDIWPHDKTYPMFEGANMTRGWNRIYSDPLGEDGLYESEKGDC